MPVMEMKTGVIPPTAAGEWLVHLCQKEGALGRALTPLENDKFNEFFELYGQHPEFKNHHVEAIHRSLTGKDYHLAQALLAKDDSKELLLDDPCALQIAIKAVGIQAWFLDRSVKESAPQLLDTVKLLMSHGAVMSAPPIDDAFPSNYVRQMEMGLKQIRSHRKLRRRYRKTSTYSKSRLTPSSPPEDPGL
ncbi:Heterokaryon incompatibility protein 6- OR allele [Apiospora sp. TS-2023a]